MLNPTIITKNNIKLPKFLKIYIQALKPHRQRHSFPYKNHIMIYEQS